MRNIILLVLCFYSTIACAAPLTANKVIKAKSGTVLVDSIITDNGNIGIDTATPSAKLDVNGNVNVSGSVTASSFTGNLTGAVAGAVMGNASTATALAGDPSPCPTGQVVSDIAANGTLTCEVAAATLSGLTNGKITKATSSSTIANSSISDDGTTVSMSTDLDVDANIYGNTITLNGAGQSYCGTSYTENCVYVGAHATRVKIGPNLDVDGDIYGDYFYGNGAGLTSVPAEISGLTIGKFVKADSATTIANSVLTETDGGIYLSGGATPIHIGMSQTTAPTIGTPGTCGSSPTATVATGSTDTAGMVTINSYSDCAGSCSCPTIVTFDRAFASTPKAIVLGSGSSPAANYKPYVVSSGATTFTIQFGSGITGTNALKVYYWVIE
jgi:hypothetical protein